MHESNLLAFAEPAAPPKPRFRPLPPLPGEESRAGRWIAAVVACVFAAAYLFFLLQYWAPAHPGVDQNGYLVGGRYLAWHGTTGFQPDPLGYVGAMYVRNDATGMVYPKYPVGLSLLYAVALWTCGDLGPKAAQLVSPLGAALSALGTYFLARRFAGTFAGLMAMLLMAFGQVMLVLANNPNSHASCTAFGVWGVFLLLGWWQTGSIWRGLLAGFLIGFTVTIRYTEGLMGLLVGVAVLWAIVWRNPFVGRLSRFGVGVVAIAGVMTALSFGIQAHRAGNSFWTAWRVLLAVLLAAGMLNLLLRSISAPLRTLSPLIGWLVPVVGLVAFNLIAMGTPTGYDTTNESKFGAAFTWEHVTQNWDKAARQLHDTGLFFVLPVGLIGMGLALRDTARRGWMLWLWFVPGVVLYMSYYWAPERGVSYLRFFLTLFPPVVVGAAVVLDRVVRQPLTVWQKLVAPTAVGVVVAVACTNTLYRGLFGIEEGSETGQGMESFYRTQSNLAALGDEVARVVPAGSVLIAPNTQLNHLQFLGDWRTYATDTFTNANAGRLRAQAERADPDEADPLQANLRDWYIKQLGNRSDEQLNQWQMNIVKQSLAAGRRAFIVCRRDQTAALTRRYERKGNGLTWKAVGSYNDQGRLRPPEEPTTNPTDPGRRFVNRNFGGRGPGGRRGPGNPPRTDGPLAAWQVIEILTVPPPPPPPTKPATKPVARPATRPAAKPATKSAAPRASRPATTAATTPAVPASRPALRYAIVSTRAATRATTRPAAVTTRPATRPAPATQPTPTTRPAPVTPPAPTTRPAAGRPLVPSPGMAGRGLR